MKRNILFFLFCLGFFVQALAQVEVEKYETITLADGSLIQGYLKHQNLVKDKSQKKSSQKVEIFAARIERVIPDSIILGGISTTTSNFTELETWWQDWFDNHKEFIEKKDGKEYVTLNHIDIRNSSKMPWGYAPGKVKVLEMGNLVKYVEFPNEMVTLDANLIKKITYPEYNDDVLSGLEETVYMRDNRSYTGHLSYLIPGKILGLFLTNKSNQLVNISFSDIQKRTKKGRNTLQSLTEQSSFLDIIETIDGRNISGVITAYDYGTKKDAPYITVLHNNNLEHVFLRNVRKLSREENGDFRAVKNVKVNDSEILFNGKAIHFKKPVRFEDYNLVLENDSIDVKLGNDSIKGELVFYLNDVKENKNISLIKLTKKNFKKRDLKYLPALQSTELVKGTGSATVLVYGFEDVVKKNINFEEEDFPSGAKKRIYHVTPGEYILYRPFNDDIVLIKLK